MKTGRRDRGARVIAGLTIFLLCVFPGRAPAQGGVEGDREVPGALSNHQGGTPAAIFVPVVLTAAGRNNSFFTSELTLTNRGSEPEGNGCIERFFRTLKEQLLWTRHFQSIRELFRALEEFRALYNQHWLIEGLGCQPPVQARQRLALHPAA